MKMKKIIIILFVALLFFGCLEQPSTKKSSSKEKAKTIEIKLDEKSEISKGDKLKVNGKELEVKEVDCSGFSCSIKLELDGTSKTLFNFDTIEINGKTYEIRLDKISEKKAKITFKEYIEPEPEPVVTPTIEDTIIEVDNVDITVPIIEDTNTTTENDTNTITPPIVEPEPIVVVSDIPNQEKIDFEKELQGKENEIIVLLKDECIFKTTDFISIPVIGYHPDFTSMTMNVIEGKNYISEDVSDDTTKTYTAQLAIKDLGQIVLHPGSIVKHNSKPYKIRMENNYYPRDYLFSYNKEVDCSFLDDIDTSNKDLSTETIIIEDQNKVITAEDINGLICRMYPKIQRLACYKTDIPYGIAKDDKTFYLPYANFSEHPVVFKLLANINNYSEYLDTNQQIHIDNFKDEGFFDCVATYYRLNENIVSNLVSNGASEDFYLAYQIEAINIDTVDEKEKTLKVTSDNVALINSWNIEMFDVETGEYEFKIEVTDGQEKIEKEFRVLVIN